MVFSFIKVKKNNRILSSIISTHVLVFLFVVFLRALKQEQKKVFTRTPQHDCSREGFGERGREQVLLGC